ncbi:MAG TPA: BamA/TamA family outer membrane protein [Vicinamibacterales bacterium]|nr:BamA/TamA family outer membrane protein [Vicinamibacterales bacterium]
MKNRLPWLALALIAIATPALAQQQAPATHAEEARRAREEKAADPAPATPGKVERFLNWFERGPFFSGKPRDGFGVRLGIENGPGFSLGPSWRTSNALGGAMQIAAFGAVSIAGDHQVTASVALPRLAGSRLALGAEAEGTHLARERFYGAGMGSARTDVAAFALDQRRIMMDATLSLSQWLQISARAGTLNTGTVESTAGAGSDHAFRVVSLSAAVDARDVPGNPRAGGRYAVAAHRYSAAPQHPYSFTRVDTEVEQHLSFWKRQRVITLRALASTALTADGHTVPFYLQPALGGSRVLRGFVDDRFRDRSLLALQAEYGWDLTPFISSVVFYETGAVGSALRNIRSRDFRGDYGLGFRFGSARTVAFRTDVAFGSGEGTRLTMRFNHAF